MGRLSSYLQAVSGSRLLAPNLRTLTLTHFTGKAHTGNTVAREIVARHLLALRWMNPNAVVYLRETKGQGVPSVSFDLWTGESTSFEIKGSLSADEVVAKVLMAARDPSEDDVVRPEIAAAMAEAGAGSASKPLA